MKQIGIPGGALPQMASELEKNWKAWSEETEPETKRLLQQNVEFFFNEVISSTNNLLREWRSAFPEPPKEFRYTEPKT